MTDCKIRKATRDDVTVIADLSSALNRSEGMTEWHRPDEETLRKYFDTMDIWLAEQEGEAVGHVAGFTHFNLHGAYLRFVVSSIYVRETLRRRGVGAALLRTVLMDKKDSGIMQLAIDVRSANKEACAFYEKLGFEKREPGFFNYRLGFEKLKAFYASEGEGSNS